MQSEFYAFIAQFQGDNVNKIELYEKSRHTSSGITFIGFDQPNCFPLHWHEHVEFHLILSGSLKIRCGSQIIDLKVHDCLIINANELHEGIEENSCKSFKFKLHPSFFNQKHYVFSNLIHDDTVISLMLKIADLHDNTDDASQYLIKGHIFHLIGYLCGNYTTKVLQPNAVQQNNEKIQKMNFVASYMHSNYASEIRLESLAEMSHYTYSYFSSAFKEVFGIPVTEYLLAIRINKASTLLLTTSMNITQIASFSGFPDANYFARAFKKETGLSPSEYRKQARGKA